MAGLVRVLLLAVLLAFLAACDNSNDRGFTDVSAPGLFPAIQLTPFAEGFDQPVQIVAAGDGSGRLFVVERGGRVYAVQNGQTTSWLDLRAAVNTSGSERGLLSLAFPPQFAQRRHFYVVYTDQAGAVVLARYRLLADSDAVDPDSGAVLLTVAQPAANHNGGGTAFGPNDGMLYLSLGDGGGSGDPFANAQNTSTLLGTLLRIDVLTGSETYAVPSTNPFVAAPGGRGEIWAYGLRNPWRFSFDRLTGDLYIADVGQELYEEIDFQRASSAGGENYGWNVMEGMHCFRAQECDDDGMVAPVAEYQHQQSGDCAVTGGYVYRGALYPRLNGVYVYGDYCSGRIRGLRAGSGVNTVLLDTSLQISSFGEDDNGELLLADYASGDIYRVAVP